MLHWYRTKLGQGEKAALQRDLRAAFLLSKIEMEVENMERETLSNRLRTAYWSLVALGCGLLLSVRPVLAETMAPYPNVEVVPGSS